ncbi:phosphatidylglycerophosphatase A family protein [Pseudaestuariivita sp.]|uniref:phosphatidylglycerophosphatase A family protein n=1 Tax=Pseudaestuariivita sp. TaxID=2211669 RepID=UPI0040589777
MTPARLIGTLGGVGLLRPAPGTWGSLAALPLAWALDALGGPVLLGACALALYPLGLWALGQQDAGQADPSEFVLDEVLGQWIAVYPVVFGAAMAGHPSLSLWPGWVAGFVLFRLFDILKPGPVGWADRQKTAQGVMLDDVVAGALAAVCVLGLAALFHGVAG